MPDTLEVPESDADLVAGCRSGDPEAWAALVQRFSRCLARLRNELEATAEESAPLTRRGTR